MSVSLSSIPGVVAGLDTQVQFNDSNTFGADSGLTWDNTNKRFKVGTAAGSALADIHILSSGGDALLRIGHAGTGDSGGLDLAVGTTVDIRGRSNNDMVFFTNNSEKVRITTAGNVGIGTTNPLEALYFVGIGRGVGAANNEGQAARWSLTTGSSGPVFKTISNTPIEFETFGLTRMTIKGTGEVGIGTTNPQAGLHGVVTNGELLWTNTEADATAKIGLWGVPHFTNAEEPFFGIVHTAGISNNTIVIGGGTGVGNAATEIGFNTAANITTPTGTRRMTISSVGVGINTDPVAGVDLFVHRPNVEPFNGDVFVEIGDAAGPRLRLGQRLTTIPTNQLSAEITTNSSGDIQYIGRSNFDSGHRWYTRVGTTPTQRMRMDVSGDLLVDNVDLSPVGIAQEHFYVIGGGIGGADNNASIGRWKIRNVSGFIEMGSVVPTNVAITSNNLRRITIGSLTGDVGINQNVATAKLDVNGSFALRRVASATDVSSDDEVIIAITDTSAPRTVTISTEDITAGFRIFIIKDESGGAGKGQNKITVATEGAETIDGQATIDLAVDFGALRLYSNGTNLFSW